MRRSYSSPTWRGDAPAPARVAISFLMTDSEVTPISHAGSAVGSGVLPKSTSLDPKARASSRAAAAVTPRAPPDITMTSSLPSSHDDSPGTIARGESSRVTRPVLVRPTSSGPSKKISSTISAASDDASWAPEVTSMALQCTSGHSWLAVLARPASPPLAQRVSGPVPFNPNEPSRRDTVTKTEPVERPARRSAGAARVRSVRD